MCVFVQTCELKITRPEGSQFVSVTQGDEMRTLYSDITPSPVPSSFPLLSFSRLLLSLLLASSCGQQGNISLPLIGLAASCWWPFTHRLLACWVMIIKLKYPGTYQCITSLSTPQTHSYFRGYTGESVIWYTAQTESGRQPGESEKDTERERKRRSKLIEKGRGRWWNDGSFVMATFSRCYFQDGLR